MKTILVIFIINDIIVFSFEKSDITNKPQPLSSRLAKKASHHVLHKKYDIHKILTLLSCNSE